MWRCFQHGTAASGHARVCSTHVEMFLLDVAEEVEKNSLLHACGDVSTDGVLVKMPDGVCSTHVEMFPSKRSRRASSTWFAPRMWRCFSQARASYAQSQVCSTHVEMFPQQKSSKAEIGCLLHACGDVSTRIIARRVRIMFAPRMWRCFPHGGGRGGRAGVCSTHVEMFPASSRVLQPASRLLHACGDVSLATTTFVSLVRFAPRMWRCFSASF